jgi:hypothetical protein
VPDKGMGVQVPPRTHRDHPLTCESVMGYGFGNVVSGQYLQVRAMGVKSALDRRTITALLRARSAQPCPGPRRPHHSHGGCRRGGAHGNAIPACMNTSSGFDVLLREVSAATIRRLEAAPFVVQLDLMRKLVI